MNSKLNKKIIIKTPFRPPFNHSLNLLKKQNTSFESSSKSSSNAKQNNSSTTGTTSGVKSISVEEYSKLLFQNQRMAKENAYLKSKLDYQKEQIHIASKEVIELRQKLSAADTHIKLLKNDLKLNKLSQIDSVSEQIKSAVTLLMEDYLAIDSIRNQMNEFKRKVESTKEMMNSLQTLIECNDSLNESEISSEITNDPFRSNNRSSNGSRLSAQEIIIRRRLSAERIKRDFQILGELSTILETSSEQRNSSLGLTFDNNTNNNDNRVNRDQSLNTIGEHSDPEVIAKVTTSTATSTTKTISNTNKPIEDSKVKKTKKKKETEPKTKNKSKTKTQFKHNPNSNPKSKANDFDENDGNKENIILGKVGQRYSERIRSKSTIL